MKIVFISTYPPSKCGLATYSLYLGQALKQADAEIHILTVDPDGDSSADVSLIGDYVDHICEAVVGFEADIVHIQHEYGIFGHDERFLQMLAKLRRVNQTILLTLHTVRTSDTLCVGCAPLREGIPSRPEKRRRRRNTQKGFIEDYQRRIGHYVDQVIVHQPSAAKVLIQQGLPESKVAIIPHGTLVRISNDRSFAKLTLGLNGGPLIASLGFFNRSKNPLHLLAAFHQLRKYEPSALLWMNAFVRDPSPENLDLLGKCKDYINANGLTSGVIFHPEFQSEDDIERILAAADVVSLVYDEDTYSSSGILHLAVGAGCLIVASEIEKFAELREISCSALVSSSSIDELSEILLKIMHDQAFNKRLREVLKKFAMETSWNVIAIRHLDIYQKAIGQIYSHNLEEMQHA